MLTQEGFVELLQSPVVHTIMAVAHPQTVVCPLDYSDAKMAAAIPGHVRIEPPGKTCRCRMWPPIEREGSLHP